MNTFTKFAAAAASFVAFSAAAGASQAAVFIGLQQAGVNGGAITTVASDPAVAIFGGAYGTFEGEIVSGADAVFPTILTSNTNDHNIVGAGGTLDIWVTLTDITGIVPMGFVSAFTSTTLPAGWSVTMTSYASAANAIYGGTQLAQNTFNSIGTYQTTTGFAGGYEGTYSVTQRYTLNATSTGSAVSTQSITAVPEPATWALMIAGFGGAGAMIRTRRRQAALA